MWLFAVTSVVFMLSPVWVLGDSNYSMLLSENIIRNHTTYLSHATSGWNAAFDIDSHPERLKDWSNPQFMAGRIPAPDRIRP
jgi:hypothetical protein